MMQENMGHQNEWDNQKIRESLGQQLSEKEDHAPVSDNFLQEKLEQGENIHTAISAELEKLKGNSDENPKEIERLQRILETRNTLNQEIKNQLEN